VKKGGKGGVEGGGGGGEKEGEERRKGLVRNCSGTTKKPRKSGTAKRGVKKTEETRTETKNTLRSTQRQQRDQI